MIWKSKNHIRKIDNKGSSICRESKTVQEKLIRGNKKAKKEIILLNTTKLKDIKFCSK